MQERRVDSKGWTTFTALLFFLFISGSMASQCYHGLETVSSNDALNTDSNYWMRTTGQDTAADPVNCTKRVGNEYDTCSIFCRTYRMLSSGENLVRCRRFCMRWEECNATRVSEFEFCQAERDVPNGNLMLLECSQKCSFGINSNYLPTCDSRGGGGCCGLPTGGEDEVCTTGSAVRMPAFGGSTALMAIVSLAFGFLQLLR
mmetsp:Transcript_11613/g.27358  ORF Transcript_11613/g.27358 Transcript_11613/m.27358 type:complete len:202 (-) Transcript_11613:219-824(-)